MIIEFVLRQPGLHKSIGKYTMITCPRVGELVIFTDESGEVGHDVLEVRHRVSSPVIEVHLKV